VPAATAGFLRWSAEELVARRRWPSVSPECDGSAFSNPQRKNEIFFDKERIYRVHPASAMQRFTQPHNVLNVEKRKKDKITYRNEQL
jgi:hypothetical protein